MRRFVAGLTILVFMTLAGEVAAQSNGTGDPLGLISSAVIQPYWSVGRGLHAHRANVTGVFQQRCRYAARHFL